MIFAVTGGIGSGKSYVCRLIEKEFDIKVYDCDSAAKRLMAESPSLQKALSIQVGRDIFPGGCLDRKTLKQFITASKENAQKADDIVHPAVAEDFRKSGCEWIESAILFESGFINRLHPDKVICVTAPLEIRIQRIMERDHCTREQAKVWIDAQMPQEEKAAKADCIIVNDGSDNLQEQIETILTQQPTPHRV